MLVVWSCVVGWVVVVVVIGVVGRLECLSPGMYNRSKTNDDSLCGQ